MCCTYCSNNVRTPSRTNKNSTNNINKNTEKKKIHRRRRRIQATTMKLYKEETNKLLYHVGFLSIFHYGRFMIIMSFKKFLYPFFLIVPPRIFIFITSYTYS